MLICQGCGERLSNGRVRTFCGESACYARFKRNPNAPKGPTVHASAMELTESGIRLRRRLRRLAPNGAIGYRILQMPSRTVYPLLGKTKRFRGNLSDSFYYVLEPYIELPRVPYAGEYMLFWVMLNDVLIAEPKEPYIVIDFTANARIDYRHFIRGQAMQIMKPLKEFHGRTTKTISLDLVAPQSNYFDRALAAAALEVPDTPGPSLAPDPPAPSLAARTDSPEQIIPTSEEPQLSVTAAAPPTSYITALLAEEEHREDASATILQGPWLGQNQQASTKPCTKRSGRGLGKKKPASQPKGRGTAKGKSRDD